LKARLPGDSLQKGIVASSKTVRYRATVTIEH